MSSQKQNGMVPFFRKKLLWVPLLFFTFALLFDRLLSSEWVRPYTEAGAEYYFYEMKDRVLSALLREKNASPPEKKTLIFFGTSHMGEFSLETIRKKRKDLIVYNFSAPSAPFSYHNYNLEKILGAGVKPDYAILEFYPDSMTDFCNRYPLRYSYDLPYFFRYAGEFSTNDWDTFLRSRVFRTTVFPPRFKEAIHRIKDPYSKEMMLSVRNLLMNESDKFNGGIPNVLLTNTPPEKLEEESVKYYNDIYRYIKLSSVQKRFLFQFLKTAKKEGIKVILWSPLLYEGLESRVKAAGFYAEWKTIRSQTLEFENVFPLDMNDYRGSVTCRKFIDPHHLSGGCYPEPTEILIDRLDAKR
ncbi:DUF1574 domain-containing protein [Leptospira gomenensis]|uniref:DUF1574 domain-containing protein n=1 Tax=Leptospira gomenensis TaxID=2484974 RepID=A0A5F1YAG9_9LEPT|nr:DUF1574 domain-containing protein [Leptospira gomenensis]TGK33852.1 DUF1574 domain-containing protein [Leptospira gomenensis]TGK36307.1 DUF1574 domain-containing protein [Leptospira gomenensis]TGK52077.1 DUF1574 domain-containing protein [Leptospira gomenensis]TGK59874.1 DUF1574 domain-containing protein [Leptospira gomenensis]